MVAGFSQNRTLSTISSDFKYGDWNHIALTFNSTTNNFVSFSYFHLFCSSCLISPPVVDHVVQWRGGVVGGYFRKTIKPPHNIFRAWHVSPRFCAADDCLVIIYITQKKRKANSNALSPPEKVKVDRIFAKLHRTGQQFCDNLTFRIIFCEEVWKPLRKRGTVKPSFLRPKTVKPFQ